MADTITADKLCSLTGLTDRRHRQLAAAGYFPAPERALYVLTPTISGILRYYRETTQRRGNLTELKEIKMAKENELLDLKMLREKRLTIAKRDVDALLLHIAVRAKTMLYQFLETEAPPKLDGLPASAQRKILREMADAICDAMADSVAEFEKT